MALSSTQMERAARLAMCPLTASGLLSYHGLAVHVHKKLLPLGSCLTLLSQQTLPALVTSPFTEIFSCLHLTKPKLCI